MDGSCKKNGGNDEKNVGKSGIFESFRLGLARALDEITKKPSTAKPLKQPTVECVADFIKTAPATKIIIMCGAGVSTAAGIPDFRSPGSGIYANLQEFGLPYPGAIFNVDYFRKNPTPFFRLARSLLPEKLRPTMSHYFMRLLCDKGVLLRVYSQNIDGLERLAGIPEEKIVEAHGSFSTSHCLRCDHQYPFEWLKNQLKKSVVPLCPICKGVVKPDIVFFGEQLPRRFYQLFPEDFSACDLLIVMGTSLVVIPFASLIDKVPHHVPRLLINREIVGVERGSKSGFMFDSKDNFRDVAMLGSTDEGCLQLAELLGWKEELLQLINTENADFEQPQPPSA